VLGDGPLDVVESGQGRKAQHRYVPPLLRLRSDSSFRAVTDVRKMGASSLSPSSSETG
jgi:hypothetical protein